MKLHWLIEKDTFNEGNPERLIEIIESRGMGVKVVGYVPFEGGLQDRATRKVYSYDKLSQLFPNDDCVVAYGSINLCRRLLSETPWAPTAWMNLKNLSCQSYYAYWGQFCLQREYVMLPWADLPRVKNRLGRLSEDNCLFIRPNDNNKVFSGKVVHEDEFDKWYKQEDDCYAPPPDSLAVVARPIRLDAEWRVVIVDGKVITASLYRKNGIFTAREDMEQGAPSEVMELASILALQEWQPDKAYVADICLTSGEYRLVEIGSPNAAGLYKCDLEKFVESMSAQAAKDWRELHE